MSDRLPMDRPFSTVSECPSSIPNSYPAVNPTRFHTTGPERQPQWKAYALGALIAVVLGVMVYQQIEMNHLRDELSLVSDSVRSDLRNRLDATDTKVEQVNDRLSYLDSKISAVDRKAQISLDKWREHEKNDFFGNLWKNITRNLGMK